MADSSKDNYTHRESMSRRTSPRGGNPIMGNEVGVGVRLGGGQLSPESGSRLPRDGGTLVFKKKDAKRLPPDRWEHGW